MVLRCTAVLHTVTLSMVKWDKEAQRAVERLQGLDAPPPDADSLGVTNNSSRDLELGRKGEESKMLLAAEARPDAQSTIAAGPGTTSSSRLSIIPEVHSSDESESLLHRRSMTGAGVGRGEAGRHDLHGGSGGNGLTADGLQGSDHGLTDANVEVRAVVHQVTTLVADAARDGGGGEQMPTQGVK